MGWDAATRPQARSAGEDSVSVLDRIYGGWLGKVIGVTYGAPVEGWTHDQIRRTFGDLVEDRDRFYLVPMRRIFGADDDTSHPAIMVQALADLVETAAEVGCHLPGTPDPAMLGRAWLNYIPEEHGVIWRGGYGVSTEHTAMLNLLAGIAAPRSGAAILNGPVVAQQIGGQIFSDIWGLLFPGEPELAAAWADAASSVSHDLDGRVGARFIASLVSTAFSGGPVEQVVERALATLPPEAHYTAVMRDVWQYWRSNPEDWRAARAFIEAKYGYDRYPGACHIIPNAAVVTMSLLYGGGDFDRSVRLATASGWDTDCNAGNVGAVVGVLCGPEGIPHPWREPLSDRFVGSGVLGARNLWTVPAFVRLVDLVGRALRRGQKGGHGRSLICESVQRLSFDFPGSTEGVAVDDGVDNAVRAVLPARAPAGDGTAGHGGGALKLVVRDLSAYRTGRVVFATFLDAGELAQQGYDPAFSPMVYGGQLLRARILSQLEDGCPPSGAEGLAPSAGFFVDVLEQPGPARIRRRIRSDKVVYLPSGRWVTAEWRIPAVAGIVERIGVELQASSRAPRSGEVYLDDLAWDGPSHLNVRFGASCGAGDGSGRAGWLDGRELMRQIGWTYSKGHWCLERGALTGSCADHAEALTGSAEWRDVDVEAEIRPQTGEWHLLLVRAQGARRWYGAGLGPGGSLVIVKRHDERFDVVRRTTCGWRPGVWYTVRVQAQGTTVVVSSLERDASQVRAPVTVSWTDQTDWPWTHGCIGLGLREASRTACASIRVEAS